MNSSLRLYRLLRRSILALLLVGATLYAHAQDVIVDLDGNELPGQVLEITPTQVLYRTPDTDPLLPPIVLDKNTLFMVRFGNGTKEVFGVAAPEEAPMNTATTLPGGQVIGPDGLTLVQREQLRTRGHEDALRYYNRTGPFVGSMLGTAATFGGVVPAVVIAVVRPKAYKNKELNQQLLAYPSYVEGYETTARKRKTWPVVGGYLSGLGLLVLILGATLGP